MGAMKRFAEDVSVEMGFGGELNDLVLTEAHRQLEAVSIRCRRVVNDDHPGNSDILEIEISLVKGSSAWAPDIDLMDRRERNATCPRH